LIRMKVYHLEQLHRLVWWGALVHAKLLDLRFLILPPIKNK
jgi:hypothetical protein